MDSSLRRRRFIAATATGAAALLTGCTGGGGNGDGNGDDGGDGSGDGTEDGTGDSGNGDGEGGDGGDGTGDNGGDGGDGDRDGSGGSNPTLGDAYGMTEEFAFDAEVEGEETGTVSGRFYQGNTYVQFDSGEGSGEFYNIDGDQYIVTGDRCLANPGGGMTPDEDARVDPGDYESEVSEFSDITPTGTTTIDGDRVYVYEFTQEMGDRSETITYYVTVDSGYLRRVESPQSTVNFHSWNNVDPIEAPDMECQDMSEMPGGPGGMPEGPGSDMPSGP